MGSAVLLGKLMPRTKKYLRPLMLIESASLGAKITGGMMGKSVGQFTTQNVYS